MFLNDPCTFLKNMQGNLSSVFMNQTFPQWEISDFSVLQKYLLVTKAREGKAALN